MHPSSCQRYEFRPEIAELHNEIERLRTKLNSLIGERGNFIARDEMQRVSNELDELILKYMLLSKDGVFSQDLPAVR